MEKLKNFKVEKLNSGNIQKSFYNKAYQVIFDDGARFLFSYKTLVAYQLPDQTYHRVWGGWSATTSKHLQAFGFGLCKHDWLELICESEPTEYMIELNRAYCYEISETNYHATYY